MKVRVLSGRKMARAVWIDEVVKMIVNRITRKLGLQHLSVITREENID
jgi:hypothetical protein